MGSLVQILSRPQWRYRRGTKGRSKHLVNIALRATVSECGLSKVPSFNDWSASDEMMRVLPECAHCFRLGSDD